MDPASSTLGRMLLDEIAPVVMVLRTPLVEEACQKNNLSFIKMLNPFSSFSNIDVPVRTASDQPYRLHKFKLRLFYASDIRQPDIEVAKERLKQVIINAGKENLPDLCSDPPPIESILTSSESQFLPSWFQFFNKELIHAVSFSEHEAFDHPVACLLAVSSKDEDPINKFVDLFNTDQLPSLLNDGAMDPKILKHFLLVHDNQDGPPEKAAKILAEMRSTFGANDCHLLCINSSEDGLIEHQENPWESYRTDASDRHQLGCFLSLDDVNELKQVMHDLSSKHVIPHMELKIRVLNQQVSATRKGFRNQIKNLWWRKGKEDAQENPKGSVYNFSSIESQIRVLGDYSFMLRDYELALSNYRLLSTDYKLDKAWKHYAGVQEMMGLTYFMLDQSRKDAEYCMENAFTTYSKIGSLGQRNATRCGLWWVELLKARDQYKDAANVYFRISGEEPLHSAVMLEQASYCYLFCTPTMLRKYGFHLVLSGDLYKRCDQIIHAIRTYKCALSVFSGTTWSHIRDHVHFHLGKWYASLGQFDVAIKHLIEVLACGHQSKATQELFLRDFFQVVQNTGKSLEILKLQLPLINIPSIKLVVEDHRTYASQTAANVRESLWQSLEEEMIPSLSTIKTNWLNLQSKILPKKYKQLNVCIAGEAIKVDVELKNPLQIPITISNISLICEHSAKSDDSESALDSSGIGTQSDEKLRELAISGSSNSEMFLSEVDISLGAAETAVVQLTVTPRAEGTLTIVGMKWKLSGSVAGFCNFKSDSNRRKIKKGRQKHEQSVGGGLKFLVIKSLPKLEGVISRLPKTVYAGDLRRLSLVLRNPSDTPVKNLKMRVSNLRFLKIGNRDTMEMEFPGCLEKRSSSAQSCIWPETSNTLNTVFVFPEDTVIHGGTPLSLPLWVHAAAAGQISLYITIYYEMEDTSTAMRYRLLRMHFDLEVMPSLDLSFQISPCPSKFQEFLVRMDVVNRSISDNFCIHQLSSFGSNWDISLLQPVDMTSQLNSLMAGEALSCFFKLKKCRQQVDPEGDESIPTTALKADVVLGPGSDGELYDIYRPPLFDFHQYERLHNRGSDQEDQSTVDFILISQSRSDNNPGLQSFTSIFTHHRCHCSVASPTPLCWLVDGPRTVRHDFAVAFCEIKLMMTIHNAADAAATVRINTIDSAPNVSTIPVTSGNEEGWQDLSLPNDIKITSDVPGTRVRKFLSPDRASPFIWSGSSSTKFEIEPQSSVEIPLEVCVFSPGTYDLSNYSLEWTLLSASEDGNDTARVEPSSGTCQGHSYFLTVLQLD